MYNAKLVLSYTAMLVVQALLVLLFGYLWLSNDIDLETLLISLTSIVISVDIIFFILVMIFQWEQGRYKILGVSSILLSLTFLGVLYRYFSGGSFMSTFSDINLFTAAIFIFITTYVLVDDTTYSFVKGILAGNMILLLLFRTPLFFVIVFTIHGFFQATDNITAIIFSSVFGVHVFTSLILGVLKIKMMNRIDFL